MNDLQFCTLELAGKFLVYFNPAHKLKRTKNVFNGNKM